MSLRSGRTIFFEQAGRILRPPLLKQHGRIHQMRVADQQRIWKILAEIGQGGQSLRIVTRFQIGVPQVVSDIVTHFARSGLGAVERVNRLGIFVIKRARISNDQPCQRSGIFLGMTPRISLDSGIRRRSAILQQLLRHRAEVGRGCKRLSHSSHSRRNRLAALLLAGFLRRGFGQLTVLMLAWSSMTSLLTLETAEKMTADSTGRRPGLTNRARRGRTLPRELKLQNGALQILPTS